jgi:hypothetical protein
MALWKPSPQELEELRAYAKTCAGGLDVRLDVDDSNVISLRVQRGGENALLFNRTTVAATDFAAAKRLVKAALDDILGSLKVPGTLRTAKR